jgi:hypothetical protein
LFFFFFILSNILILIKDNFEKSVKEVLIMNKRGSIALIILGLVAVIALVGLILMFNKGATGKAALPVCKDSDGGMVYGVKGTVTYEGGRTATDTCTRSGISAASGPGLMEMYCNSDDGLGRKAYICPNTCVNGACI